MAAVVAVRVVYERGLCGNPPRPSKVVCFRLSLFCPRPCTAPVTDTEYTNAQDLLTMCTLEKMNEPFHLPILAALALLKKLSLLCRDLLFGLSHANGFHEPSAAPPGFFTDG